MQSSHEPMCNPFTASHFELTHKIEVNGIHAEIRNFGWDESCEKLFEADSYYIDFSLTPPSTRPRLLYTDRRPTPPLGEIVFLPQGSVFNTQCDPCEQRLLCLTFENDCALRLFEDDGRDLDLSPCFDVRAPRVKQALARLGEEVREPGFCHDILIESIVVTLVVELCRHLRNQDDGLRGRMAEWRLRRLKDRIEADLARPLSIADLAAECGMSPRHLIRTFKITVGATLSDYIAEARIRRAKQALSHEGALIKVVAGDCGFQNAAAFSASFRKATGMTPKEYRQERFRYAS